MKLNLGCGELYLKGYKNIDVSTDVKADEYYDIRTGIREPDNSVEEVLCGCILEQICSNEEFLFVMNEIWRVLKPDGKLIGYVPDASLPIAFQDPFDCRRFTKETFKYFDIDHIYYQRFGKHYGFKPWKVIKCFTADNGIIHFEMKPVK
ncbi:MAG TPA: hypothetical protein ENG63_10115 [Candidatus Desulfofervidus auxilii]|uniref:Methyltransferase domain-containing protein n=1 Tax=Desulfofervidus auxilii TaxID=1621989 RepID=A0A7C0U3V5_DESA2|nr:hypothetical protein [Candidatus Desulfofervidus auxilii]